MIGRGGIGVELRPGPPEEGGMLPERIELARECCAQWVSDGHTPALAVCVARRGVIVLHECWGVLGPEPGAPALARDSLFPVASLTKPLTATLAMQLVEDGKLGLNRPVVEYLPELDGAGTDDILVHHLLTHTSGYSEDDSWDEFVSKKLEAGFAAPPCPDGLHPTLHEMLSILWDAPRAARAGEVMIYGNHNYLLLGEIVRRLSGCEIDALSRARLFDPLGMRDCHYVLPPAEARRVVQRPAHFPMGSAQGPFFPGLGSRDDQQTPHPGSGVFSTARDYAVFGQMILNGGRYGSERILSRPAVSAMTRDQIPGLKARLGPFVADYASWGYGLGIESPQKWPYFNGSLFPLGTLHHAGGGGTMFWVDAQHELVGAYFEVTKFISNYDLFANLIMAAVAD